ncbi:MAG: M56 family metallopeptidase [Planctomycetaceae bacterium]
MNALLDTFFDALCEVMYFAWLCAVETPLAAALLAAVVFAIQLTCARWLRPAQLGLLWSVVLLRLMLPAVPQSPLSLQNLLRTTETPPLAVAAPHSEWPPVNTSDFQRIPPAVPVPAAIAEESLFDQILNWLPLVWELGCFAILAGTTLRYLFFAFRLRRDGTASDPRLLQLLEDCHARLRIRRPVRLVITTRVRQPAVLGVWRPKLLLPPHVAALGDADLRLVLLHELAHVRGWDVAVNWLLLVVRAVHWANPVCWLAASRFLNLREQARDEMVLRASAEDVRHDYSALLLTLAAHYGQPARWRVMLPSLLPQLVCGLFEKQAIAARLKAIRARRVQPRWQFVAAGLLICGAVVCGGTDPLPPTLALIPAIDPVIQAAVQNGALQLQHDDGTSRPSSPLESRTYDITDAVRQIAAIHEVHIEVAADWARGCIANAFAKQSSPPRQSADTTQPLTPSATLRVDAERRLIDVVASASNHERIAQWIPAWELSGMLQVCVEVRFFGSPIDVGQTGQVTWKSLLAPTSALPPRAKSPAATASVTGASTIEQRLATMTAIVDPPAMQRLTELFQQDARSNVMFAPKITMFNGQAGTVTSEVQRPFVTGIRLVDGRREPQIEVCPDGLEVELQPVIAANQTSTRITGRVILSSIIDVKTTSTQLIDGPVTIQLPSVERRIIDFNSDLRDGETLLVGCPPPSDKEGFFYVALTARLISETDAGLVSVLPAAVK